jgi:Tfx family DNA-binding protein
MPQEMDDVDALLARVGFDAEENALTRRQATVLALRGGGRSQADIAEQLGTSRANVANVEASARANVRKAREAVAFAEALRAPVRVAIGADTDIYDVPDAVYAAADEAAVTVEHGAPELMKRVVDAAGDAIRDRAVTAPLVVIVTRDGEVDVRRPAGAVDD